MKANDKVKVIFSDNIIRYGIIDRVVCRYCVIKFLDNNEVLAIHKKYITVVEES